ITLGALELTIGAADGITPLATFPGTATDPAIKETKQAEHWWVWCALLIFPLAAIAHNAIFYFQLCMFYPFGQDYYDWPTLKAWLSRDDLCQGFLKLRPLYPPSAKTFFNKG